MQNEALYFSLCRGRISRSFPSHAPPYPFPFCVLLIALTIRVMISCRCFVTSTHRLPLQPHTFFFLVPSYPALRGHRFFFLFLLLLLLLCLLSTTGLVRQVGQLQDPPGIRKNSLTSARRVPSDASNHTTAQNSRPQAKGLHSRSSPTGCERFLQTSGRFIDSSTFSDIARCQHKPCRRFGLI